MHLYQELVAPVIQVFKGLGVVHIVDQHAAVCAPVKGNAEGLEALLACSVPYLRAYKCKQHTVCA